MLEVKNLNAAYDFLQVLWDVSIKVEEREFVGLLGPNGAGKTTLLRNISGVIKPRGGQVIFGGQDVTGRLAHQVNQAGLSYIPEDLNLFEGMPVYENLLLGAYNVHDSKKTQHQMEFVLELFPILKQRRNQLAGTLSGGERRMLALARGLMSMPRMLLVDEPSMGLAPIVVENVFATLQELNRQGITILLVEQNVPMTLSITQRAYVLEQGRVALTGKSDELLENDHLRRSYLGIS
jgi:branched-chain amino acid transport system ATP-binding protein